MKASEACGLNISLRIRTSCRCSGAVGWLVKEPGSRMPDVTSSSAVTDEYESAVVGLKPFFLNLFTSRDRFKGKANFSKI